MPASPSRSMCAARSSQAARKAARSIPYPGARSRRATDGGAARAWYAADPLGAPAQQRDRAAGIAPLGVRQPDRDLGEPLPQVALVGWARLP